MLKYYIDTAFNEVSKEKFEQELREYITNTYGFSLEDHAGEGILLIRKDKIELDEPRTPEQQGRMFANIMEKINQHYHV